MAKVVAGLSTLLLVAMMLLFLTSIMMVSSISSLSSRTWKYDVFLNFRGNDTRNSYVGHLYSKLEHHEIHAFKDDVRHQRGNSNDPALFNAIEESQIALIVFSENYADSNWPLNELVHIMKCKEERGQIVIPIFYKVSPSDVRKQKGQFGKGFSKLNKEPEFETWRKALADASNIAGWETKLLANGDEAAGIDIIVGTILDMLLHVNSVVDKNIVGMGQRVKYIESKLQIGSDGVRMIGIWGVGGGGKTTLAFSFYMKNRDYFQGYCFIGNIWRESAKHGLQKLQEEVLYKLLKKEVKVGSVQEGRYKIQKILCRRKVLIVLDDVDNFEQLDALAGSHDWFGVGSRIIITTRDSHLLETHMVDEVCLVSLLSDDEALQLFKIHAYQENDPVEDDDEVSSLVISYAKGLPLAVKILAYSLYGKDKNERMSFLDKLRDLPNPQVTDLLKISYDGLERVEKQIFLNIVCVFRRCLKENVMSILEACGFHPDIEIKVLIQKALLTISSDDFLDMHDLVQEMGLDIIRGEHSNNLKKHCRDWLSQAIEAFESLGIGKIEDIYAKNDPLSKEYIAFCSNLKILRFLEVITWHKDNYDKELYLASLLPESFQPGKLLVLHLGFTLQIELWKGEKMPSLKEISSIYDESVVTGPDCFGLSYLQVLAQLYIRWTLHQSPGYPTSTIYVYVGHCEAYKVSHLPLSSIEKHAYFLMVRQTPNENQKSEKPQQKPNEKTEPFKCPNQKQTQSKFKIMVCLEMVQRWLLPRGKFTIVVLAVMAIVSILLAILLIIVRVISCKSVMISSSLLASLSSRTWRKLDHLYSALQQLRIIRKDYVTLLTGNYIGASLFNTVQELQVANPDVDENLVGMGPRFKYIESKLQTGSQGVRMIGIWGVGGGGKTTLAFHVYMNIRDQFHGHCYIGNIREESAKHGLKKLQEKVLSEVLKTQVSVGSVEEGKYKIKTMLCRRNVLIVLDDVDNLKELVALAGSHDWFGGGSRIIITTRHSHLLIAHRVDEVCPVSLLSADEAIRLFKIHAYPENNPVEDYDELSFRLISYVNGLPLALKILGSFLYGKDKNQWISALDNLRKIPNHMVADQLKLSYDGLEHDEKQIFLYIACFDRKCQKEEAINILEAYGFNPHIGIKVLTQKALITISSDGYFDMHNLVREMGHIIVRSENPNNFENHSRAWRSQAIEISV